MASTRAPIPVTSHVVAPVVAPVVARLGRSSGRSLPARLHDEWTALCGRPAVVRRAAAWPLGIDVVSLDGLVGSIGLVPQGEPCRRLPRGERDAEADAVLAKLLVVARTDDLAARVVLQRLLPGLCSRARRWDAMHQGRWLDAFDELLTAAWLVIRTFPVERRPTHLVANLLRDTEHQAFVKATRRRRRADAVDPAQLDIAVEVDPTTEPLIELAAVIADGRHRLSDHDMDLLRLILRGHSSAEVAEILGISERTVRYHREAIVLRLRSVVA